LPRGCVPGKRGEQEFESRRRILRGGGADGKRSEGERIVCEGRELLDDSLLRNANLGGKDHLSPLGGGLSTACMNNALFGSGRPAPLTDKKNTSLREDPPGKGKLIDGRFNLTRGSVIKTGSPMPLCSTEKKIDL